MRVANFGLGLFSVAIGVVAIVEARSLPLFGAHHVSGPALFPDLISAGLIILGLLLAAGAVLRGRGEGAEPGPVPSDALEANGAGVAAPGFRLGRAATVWLGFVVAIVLLSYLGFIPTMIIFAAYIIFAVERIRGLWAVVTVIAIPLIAYAAFSYLLGVNLPPGPFLNFS